MTGRFSHGLNTALGRWLPERRLFLKSDDATRFIRLRPVTQAIALGGGAAMIGWTIFVSSLLLIDSVGSGSLREQSRREQSIVDDRLTALAGERDARAGEAASAQARFSLALRRVSDMQTHLLVTEGERRELETSLAAVQATLKRVIGERDVARGRADALTTTLAQADSQRPGERDAVRTLDLVAAALAETAAERDRLSAEADQARHDLTTLAMEERLLRERNNQIFTRLEEAVSVSMDPLDKMFKAAGLSPQKMLSQIRKGYSGKGGPLAPIGYSTKNAPSDGDTERANAILGSLDEMHMYKMVADKAPFAIPLKTAFRYTSPFGGRNDPFGRGHRRHEGVDFAGAHGSPILSTADGVVVKAGWVSGYGQMVQIRHEFGLETRYGHMSRIRASVGQKVSRGDQIGDMGNTGRSTGTHLHYEIRVDGQAVNPMTFILAARNVL